MLEAFGTVVQPQVDTLAFDLDVRAVASGPWLDKINTKSFDESRLDFKRCWDNAILPAGTDGLKAVLAAAGGAGVPPEAAHFDIPHVQRLAGLCHELQRLYDDDPFYLACRTVGTLFDVDPATASRWLRMLEMDELIVAVQRGSNKTMKATRWLELAWVGW